MLPAGDRKLVQIVEASLADATLRANRPDGTSWLACRPGCTPCCHGVFRISKLDAERLRSALSELQHRDPDRARGVQRRARERALDLAISFPGDPRTGILNPDGHEWDAFADLPEADAPCPVLDPVTGRCELYAGRPLTCRIFGPPVLNEAGIGFCELCYVGATEGEILAGEMHLTHGSVERDLDRELVQDETIIAWALLAEPL